MFNYQGMNIQQVREGVKKFGPAIGSRKIIDQEFLHAQEAIQTGTYITYSCQMKKSECTRLGSSSKCFCGHLFKNHKQQYFGKKFNTSCENCSCKTFKFVPTRPEECGMYWLPRRKDFNVTLWKAPCKCNHNCEEHQPNYPLRCQKCTCQDFQSYFACISCDQKWEDHEVLYETLIERQQLGKSTGQKYLPLSDNPDIQEEVFKEEKYGLIKQFSNISQYQNQQVFPFSKPPKLSANINQLVEKEQIYKTNNTRERPKSLNKKR